MKKGGAAKGELVLAIYELGNCFRHGWGVNKDPLAARSYYETAANLGDVDSMNEVAWCYEHGFGGKKDKVSGGGLGLSCRGPIIIFMHWCAEAREVSNEFNLEKFGRRKDRNLSRWAIKLGSNACVGGVEADARKRNVSSSLRRDTIVWRKKRVARRWVIHGRSSFLSYFIHPHLPELLPCPGPVLVVSSRVGICGSVGPEAVCRRI